MGKAFQLKFDDVAWEYNDEHQKAWEEGRTGVPFIDAAMRQANHEGALRFSLPVSGPVNMLNNAKGTCTIEREWRLLCINAKT